MYGHTTAGDDWHEFFDNILVNKMRGQRVEEFPSLWFFDEWRVLVAAYVDDVITAGPSAGVQKFWASVCEHVTFDNITTPGRYLGRDHAIVNTSNGKAIFMSMTDFARSAVALYEDQFGVLKPCDTPFISESLLTVEGFESSGHLAGNAASLLMKLLWLARLCRPDLSYAIVSLAGAISKWSRNHDLMLKRLLGYVKNTSDLGLWGILPHVRSLPTLNMYCDADLAGDPLTAKSHSGVFVCLLFETGECFPLSWSSKRQTAVARSTTEAELAAASEGVFQDGLPIQSLLEKIHGVEIQTFLFEDNTSCITVIQSGYSPKLRSMNKTHRISVAALAEAVERKLVVVKHVSTKEQLADLLTKALNRQTFLLLRSLVGVASLDHGPPTSRNPQAFQ